MRIRVILEPPGFAPREIREKWVGIVLESTGREDPELRGSLRVGTENLGGYKVSGPVAFAALAEYDSKAHSWWAENALWAMTGELIFRAEVCEEAV